MYNEILQEMISALETAPDWAKVLIILVSLYIVYLIMKLVVSYIFFPPVIWKKMNKALSALNDINNRTKSIEEKINSMFSEVRGETNRISSMLSIQNEQFKNHSVTIHEVVKNKTSEIHSIVTEQIAQYNKKSSDILNKILGYNEKQKELPDGNL